MIYDIIMMVVIMKRALVLSGGGAKGAYQIGVWKALRKLKIKIDIVTGTSVGALNGTLFVQNDYFSARRLWRKMNFNFVFDEKILRQYNHCKTTKDMLGMFSLNFIKQGGMSVNSLEHLVKQYFKPKKFFASSTDFGISTYNFSDLKPVKLKKRDLEKKNVTDYVIASSCCFPAFKMKKIGSKKYIDGGFFDNLPINLAIDMGADEIIAVDLHAPGIKEKVQNTKIPITYIEPHNDIGGFLNFNSSNAKKAMALGYLDTMKVYHYLEGEKFTFKKGTLKKCQERYNFMIVNNMNFIFDFVENKTTLEELLTLAVYKRMISVKKNIPMIFIDILEHLGTTFHLDKNSVYSLTKFHRLLFKKLRHTPDIAEKDVKTLVHEKNLLSYLNRQVIIRYFYKTIFLCHEDSSYKKPLCKLALIFPKEFLDALYLYSVKERSVFIW